jgi:hypothetical protein
MAGLDQADMFVKLQSIGTGPQVVVLCAATATKAVRRYGDGKKIPAIDD